ncbi:MAG: glycosyltransferase, partial [Phycisphaerales bacterium]
AASSRLDVVHVVGSRAWKIGLHTAASAGSHLAIDLLDAADLDRIRPFENRAARHLGSDSRLIWLAPGQKIFEAATSRARSTRVFPAFWGTHTPEHPRPAPAPDAPLSFAIITTGTQTRNLIHLLDALKKFEHASSDPDVPKPLYFLDEHALTRNHHAAEHAREIGINDQLSIVPSLEHNRRLAMQCDAILLPDGNGQQRSIILDAMANAVSVIAAPDPLLSGLIIDGKSGFITQNNSADAWLSTLRRAFDPSQSTLTDITSAAREFTRTERSASTHIAAIAEAYEHLCGSKPIPFEANST